MPVDRTSLSPRRLAVTSEDHCAASSVSHSASSWHSRRHRPRGNVVDRADGGGPELAATAVKFIVTLGPGSGVDIGTRMIGDRRSHRWGQPVVVENRPGEMASSPSMRSSAPMMIMRCWRRRAGRSPRIR
jgi:hypothetical protein